MDIDTMGTERIRALIDQHFIVSPADIYELPEKKDQLLGLEVNFDQYTKGGNGELYVSLKKAFYALTKGLSLSAIDAFLSQNEGAEQAELLGLFENFIRQNSKNVSYNVPVIWKMKDFLAAEEFDHIEDYMPLAVVLAIIFKKQPADFQSICHKENTVHDVMQKYSGEVQEDQLKQINQIKGNTFQEGVVNNMLSGIEASKKQPFEKVLFALGIRNIGENTAQLLARHFKSLDNILQASGAELLEINGVGETLVNSLKAYFADQENIQTIERLKAHGLQFEVEESEQQLQSNKLEGLKILASGKLNHFKRDEIVDFIHANGGTYVKSVSKSLDFIIEGEDMGPSKKEKAEKLGVKLISEEEFLNLLN